MSSNHVPITDAELVSVEVFWRTPFAAEDDAQTLVLALIADLRASRAEVERLQEALAGCLCDVR